MARFVLLLLIISLIAQLQSCGVDGAHSVPITLLESAVAKGAVCLDGSPPAYAYSPGFGDGVDNWHVYLQAGGWCSDLAENCFIRSKGFFGSSTVLMKTYNSMQFFDAMFDDNSTFNPDFYNWNVFYIYYCDGSSFMSDVKEVDQDNLSYRGARIYDAMMEELLAKGIRKAKNALLSGSSAGGLATILHCDKFRALFPTNTRVKCLSDSGFFIHGKHLLGADIREKRFASVISKHGLANALPTSCTTKFDPALCLFPEYLVPDVQTPLFILESAFDKFQVSFSLFPYKERTPSWINCSDRDLKFCNSTELQLIKDFGTTFIETLKKTITNSPFKRGYFVHNCYLHTHMEAKGTSTCSCLFDNNVLAGKTVAQAVGDWYFDRSEFHEIDVHNDLPRNCSIAYPWGMDKGPDFDAKCSAALHHEIVGISKLEL